MFNEKVSTVAACVLFVWDYILTFGLEVQYIWKSRWTVVKVVYLIQRYLPFVDSCYLELYSKRWIHSGLQPTQLRH